MPGRASRGLFDELHGAVVDGDAAALLRLREVGCEHCGLAQIVVARREPRAAQDDVRAVNALGVEPVVALVGLFCQLVVLHVAAADEDLKPARRFECARGEGALELLFAARLRI